MAPMTIQVMTAWICVMDSQPRSSASGISTNSLRLTTRCQIDAAIVTDSATGAVGASCGVTSS